MVIKTLHMEKFEYFCSRAVIVIGMVLFFFLSASSLLYTEEFEANNVERLERVKDPLAWNLFLMVLILLLLFYVGKWLFKDEAKKERNIRILLAFTCCYAVVYGLLCYLEKQDRKEMEFMAAAQSASWQIWHPLFRKKETRLSW